MTAIGIGRGVGFGGHRRPSLTEFGTVFTDSFARAALGGDYTTNGAATWTTDGAKLTTTGGTGVHTMRLQRSYYTCLERHTIVIEFTMTSAIGATTFGIGAGVYGTNTFDHRSYAIQYYMGTGANNGKLICYSAQGVGPTYTTRKTSASALSALQNKNYRLTVVRNRETITYTVQNLTDGGSYSDSFGFSMSYAATVHCPHGGGQFYLNSYGGTIDITKWEVTGNDYKNVKTLLVGDSITYGIAADLTANRWASNVSEIGTNDYTVSGGPSDNTNEALDRIGELLSMNPQYAVMMIGGNDIQRSISSTIYEANYTSIRNQLKAAGATIIHCLATPRDGTDMTTFNAWISSTFTSDTIINTFTPLADGTGLDAAYDPGDGVHPNAAGHALIASTITTAAPYLL